MLATAILACALMVPTAVVASSHFNNARPHARPFAVKRAGTGLESNGQNATGLVKRETGEFTWFVTGLGACGRTNQPQDFIVALNIPQYGGGENCFRQVTIEVNGKTVVAEVRDRCEDCAYGDLDFTYGLFEYFVGAGKVDGRLHGSWHWGTESTTTTTTSLALPSTSEPPPPPPSSTSTSTPPPPPSTTTSVAPSTTSETSTSASSSSSSSTIASTTSSSAPSTTENATSASSSTSALSSNTEVAMAAATGIAADGNTLKALNLAIIQMAGLVAQGAN